MPGQKKGVGLGRNPVTDVSLTYAVSIRGIRIPCFAPLRDDITIVSVKVKVTSSRTHLFVGECSSES